MMVAALVCGAAGVASATTVTYSTSGSFGSNSLSTISSGGITILFLPASSTFNAPSNVSLGTFRISGTGSATANFSDTFTLTVIQAVPLPGGSQQFGQASVSGVISVNSGNAFVQFTSPLSVTIAGNPSVTYSIASADNLTAGRLNLNFPVDNSGTGFADTTIQGAVAVPLPATANMGLILLGSVAGLGLVRRLRNGPAVVA